MEDIVVVRGGGDIATGVVQKLYRSGFYVIVVEIKKPTAIRRKVCLSEAIYNKEYKVEDLKAIYCEEIDDIYKAWRQGKIPVIKDRKLNILKKVRTLALVDATISKKNIGTNMNMAPITIALGPGYVAGVDVDVVVETNRGHDLGRLIFKGKASKNTGKPGKIAGVDKERVIYSPCNGYLKIIKDIGDMVDQHEVICTVGDEKVQSQISGILRGIIRDGTYIKKGLKIADIDPRKEEKENCNKISDKARNVGGSTLEAIMYMKNIKRGCIYGKGIVDRNFK